MAVFEALPWCSLVWHFLSNTISICCHVLDNFRRYPNKWLDIKWPIKAKASFVSINIQA